MRNARWRWLWFALMTTSACGGDLLGAPSDAGSDAPIVSATDASSPPSRDAGSGETSATDAAAVQDGPGTDAVSPTCGTESWSTVFGAFQDGGTQWDHVYEFHRNADFLDFVRTMAVQYNGLDSQGNLLCPTYNPATCTYDPRLPRTSPQDVQHSNALNEYVAPDGRDYVWVWYPPLNEWFLVNYQFNPEAYQLVVDYNAGCSPNCACDAG